VVIKARHLEHLHHRQTHLGRQRDDVALEQGAVVVVECMQVLDQQITSVAFGRCWSDQGPYVVTGLI